MARLPLTRRDFLALTGAAVTSPALPAQNPTARINVAEAERPRILAEVPRALAAPITTITAAAKAPANTFVSEVEPERGVSDPHTSSKLFRAHAIALRNTSNNVACLAAAYALTHDEQYAKRAGEHLRAWFVTENTRMLPVGDLAGREYGSETGTSTGINDFTPLAELIRSTSFLVDSQALAEDELDLMNQWFLDFAAWLDDNRTAKLARDTRDHRASAWLLIRSAIARATRKDADIEDCRKRFRSPTLRNQINDVGIFPQEVSTPNPYRNTLLNFDLLAGVCQLLASPFDLLWDYDLQDGPGMRIVAAHLYPVIAHPEKWNYMADADHFTELPGQRPALLFAGRAYNRPEYVDLWRKLDAQPVPANLAEAFPIRQPLLWTERAAHGL